MKFRKKPVVIEAFQLTEEMFWMDYLVERKQRPEFEWCGTYNPITGYFDMYAHIRTLEGPMTGKIGDWIITGVKGEHYACKPDIFEATYERVD